MNRFYDVGKIVNTHGVKGEVKVFAITDFPEHRFRKGSKLFLHLPHENTPPVLTIQSARQHKNTYIVQFNEFASINEVEKLKGGVLQVPWEERIELEADEFYYDDIIGCEVWTDEGKPIGKIKEILVTGANDVWVVEANEGKDILLPYIDDCILEVDVAMKRVKVHLLEGLVE
jgi:16S rRNA processing protein RimM